MTEQLYAQYHEKVLHYLQSRVSDLSLAEDLCATVFLKICEKLDQFDSRKAALSTWIFTITRNTLTDYYRSRRPMEALPQTLAGGVSVEDEICRRETLERLADALETLDARGRDIIILHYYSGRSLKEIAESLRISYAYVKVLHKKALSALKKELE